MEVTPYLFKEGRVSLSAIEDRESMLSINTQSTLEIKEGTGAAILMID